MNDSSSNVTQSAGGIVIGDAGAIALVRNRPDTLWFFPKGHLNDGETAEQAAMREIYEEAGLSDLEILDDLGTYMRPRIDKDGTYDESEQKEIHMFLFAAMPGANVQPSMEMVDARWAPYREVAELLQDTKDKVWFGTVFDRVREAIQRD